jgi:predicted ABC-type transport system involved in lysophospholipase L1 biosynthesis ATPase subunit
MSFTTNESSFPHDRIAVQTVDLVKSYGPAHSAVLALRGVTLEIPKGERVALLGKSGSGKSTLLNILGGLDRPTAGSVRVGGRDLATLSGKELARHRLTTVGMIFQSFNLIPSRTALQNVELPMVFAGLAPRDRRAAARQALEAVGLGQRLDHLPNQLSGGEHQRVAIARALVNNPEVLLADEPTGNLDSATAAEVIDLLMAHVRAHGTTLILVTHDEELARRCSDRVLRMLDGRLLP